MKAVILWDCMEDFKPFAGDLQLYINEFTNTANDTIQEFYVTNIYGKQKIRTMTGDQLRQKMLSWCEQRKLDYTEPLFISISW